MQSNVITLASRPSGAISHDQFNKTVMDVAEPEAGQMRLKTLYMSVDPYMRGRFNDVKSYVPPFQIGEPLEAGVVAVVEASNGGKFPEGTLVTGMGHWADYMLTGGEGFTPVKDFGLPLSYYLGILGMPGMTAWVGMKGVGEVKEGESVFISAASGAVGQVAGQIGKNLGCHVAGSVGSDEKAAFLSDEIGFDAVINYKTETNLAKAVYKACPKGVDVYFENVGGDILEAVIGNLNFHARIALCGYITAYNVNDLASLPPGPRNLMVLVGRSIKMQGFIVFNYPELCKEWTEVAAGWFKEGKLKYRESLAEGLGNAPDAFMDVLAGRNFGKQVVKIADR